MFKGWFTLIVFTLVTSSFAIPVLPHANSKKLVVLAKNVYCFLLIFKAHIKKSKVRC